MTLPNIITLFRILLLPLLIYYLFLGNYFYSLLILAFAGITDVLDGFIARKFNMISRMGAILDPIADKLFVVTLITYFVYQELIPLWFLLIILFRDFSLALGMCILKLKKITFHPKAQVSGKLSTFANFAVILLIIISHVYEAFVPYHDYFFYGATFFTLLSIIHYGMVWAWVYWNPSHR